MLNAKKTLLMRSLADYSGETLAENIEDLAPRQRVRSPILSQKFHLLIYYSLGLHEVRVQLWPATEQAGYRELRLCLQVRRLRSPAADRGSHRSSHLSLLQPHQAWRQHQGKIPQQIEHQMELNLFFIF